MTRTRAAAIALLVGFAVLTVELAAVRLFAPHFGDSAYVWTNVIGVMLVALAAGAWLGGRLAVAGREGSRLCMVLAGSAVLTALVPFLSGPLGNGLVPAALALEDAGRTLVLGSLAATLIAFAPPVALAGAVTPLLVGVLARSHDAARSSGLVAGYGTLGSLIGTFLTTHVLVPEWGSRMTMWIAALALAAGALLIRRRAVSVLATAVCFVPFATPVGPLDPPHEGAELRAEVESPYQFLQVLAEPPRDGSPARTILRINEGLDSFHSVKVEGTAWTGGCYYDWFAPLPRMLEGPARDAPRVLSLGGAAGTFDNLFRAVYPRCTVHSVEIDAAVTALGRAWFGSFHDPRSVTAGIDARVFVNTSRESWEVVLVDAYERQVYVPAHLASREFFAQVHRVTASGGLVAVNCGGVRRDDPVLAAIGRTLAAVFGEAFAFRVPASRNFVLCARKDARFDPRRLVEAEGDDATMQALLREISDARRWTRFGPEGDALVDDRPLLDALFDRSSGAEPVALVEMHGSLTPEQSAERAHDAASHGDHEATLAAAADSSAATGYLRLLAGDARWALHEPRAAEAEYHSGLTLDADERTRSTLRDRLEALAPLLASKDLADHSARHARNLARSAALGFVALLIGAALLTRQTPAQRSDAST
ncbi:MAG: fused MFS/spermidine synthase [Planctomycetota bacterium]